MREKEFIRFPPVSVRPGRGFCFGGEGIPAERYKPRYNLSGAVVRFTLQALFHKVRCVIA